MARFFLERPRPWWAPQDGPRWRPSCSTAGSPGRPRRRWACRSPILDPEQALADPDDPRMPLRAEALAGEPASGRLKKAGLYLSVRPLRSPSGEVAALVETELPRGTVASSLARLVRNLLLVACLVAALATLSGFVVSRRLTRSVQALTTAAARIGRGDLSTPAPRASGAELGTLAATMEEMRRRLLQLTSELRRRQAEGEAILTGIVGGSLQRRPRPPHPLSQPPGRGPARRDGRRRPWAASAATCSARQGQGRRAAVRGAAARSSTPASAAAPRATEHLLRPDGTRRTVVITSAPAGRGPAGPGAARRDRGRGRPPPARRRARQHLPRVQDPALRPARLDRAAARPPAPVSGRARRAEPRASSSPWSAAACA